MKNISLDNIPFQLELSVLCGQAFRWRRHDNMWYAPDPYGSKSVWKIMQKKDQLWYDGADESDVLRYFSLDHNLSKIFTEIDCDPLIHDAITRCCGLRILRQDPWECLISYICSSCANIPSIQMRIENLSRMFGEQIHEDGHEFYQFPSPEQLSNATIDNIHSCKVGYRDAYIYNAIEMALDNPHWSKDINKKPYLDAKEKLCSLHGVGSKVADCVLLFSFEKLEAVPIDVWMERIIRTKYVGGDKKLSYNKASKYAREHFGKYAGYAQEYLFASREDITIKGA